MTRKPTPYAPTLLVVLLATLSAASLLAPTSAQAGEPPDATRAGADNFRPAPPAAVHATPT